MWPLLLYCTGIRLLDFDCESRKQMKLVAGTKALVTRSLPSRIKRTTGAAFRFMSLLPSQKIGNNATICSMATMTVGKIFVVRRMVYESFTVASRSHKICLGALLSRAPIVHSQRTTEQTIFFFLVKQQESTLRRYFEIQTRRRLVIE